MAFIHPLESYLPCNAVPLRPIGKFFFIRAHHNSIPAGSTTTTNSRGRLPPIMNKFWLELFPSLPPLSEEKKSCTDRFRSPRPERKIKNTHFPRFGVFFLYMSSVCTRAVLTDKRLFNFSPSICAPPSISTRISAGVDWSSPDTVRPCRRQTIYRVV